MALQKQTISLSMAQGVDTKTDKKQVLPGKLVRLENGIFQTSQSIRKRNGYGALPRSILGGGSITAGAGLATFKDELHLMDGSSLFGYSPSTGSWKSPPGTLTPVSLKTASVFKVISSRYTPDSAFHSSGLEVVSWDGAASVGYAVIDTVTGQELLSGETLEAGSSHPKVLTFGDYFIIIFAQSSAIKFAAIPVSAPTTVTITNFVTTHNSTTPTYDAQVINGRLFLAFANSSGGTSVAYLDSSLAVSSTFTKTGEVSTGALSVLGDTSNNVWVAYNTGSAYKAFVADYNLATTVLAPTTIETVASGRTITGVISGTTASYFYHVGSLFSNDAVIRKNTLTLAGTAGTASQVVRTVGLASKAFVYGGATYFVGFYISATQATYSTYFLLRSDGVVIAKVAPATAGVGALWKLLSEVTETSDGVFHFAFEEMGEPLVVSQGISSASVAFGESLEEVELANNLHLTGGILSMYDGVNVVEHGFHLFPERVTITKSTAGTSPLWAAGSYEVVATYAWVDNQGQLHQSSPSPAQTVTSDGTDIRSLSVAVQTLCLTGKSDVFILLYQTTANGSIFFRGGNATANVTSASSVTITLGSADNSGNLQLYTTGGEVENIAVPAPLTTTTYKNRMIVIPAENPNSWWYSKEVLPGSPVEFSDLLTQNIDQRGGGVTAGAQMDDKLVLFKRRNIFVVVGDGPAASGANNDFSPAQMLPADSGCINAASVVLMRDGLMYQSEKGIYLLDRSLGVQYIGADVEAYNADTVTSARLVPDTTEVRFTLESGVALVYDYLYRQWSVFTNHAAVGSVVFQNIYCYVQADGTVMQETPGAYTDNGSFIQLFILTSWLALVKLQGFQRIYKALILGDYKSAHTLSVKAAYDFDTTFTQTETITASSTPPYQYRIDFARQTCEALQLEIKDVQTSNFGEGLSISAIDFEVAAKSGLNKMAPGRTYG